MDSMKEGEEKQNREERKSDRERSLSTRETRRGCKAGTTQLLMEETTNKHVTGAHTHTSATQHVPYDMRGDENLAIS